MLAPEWRSVLCCTVLPARARSGPRKHQRRARSDDVSWSANAMT
jgi:hypothetical protein